MSQFIAFNVNDYVKVKLTDYGRKVYRRDYHALTGRYPTMPQEDADGYSTWQMHHLMEVFGRYPFLGTIHLPFETEIKVEHREAEC